MVPGYTGFERIGEGGWAEVFRATGDDGREVAVKVMRAGLCRDASAVRRFEREGRILLSLAHPLIPRVLAVARTRDARPALVMELVRGADARAMIARGASHWRVAVAVGVGVARALDHAHERGVIHRDVKPSNVMMADDATSPEAVRVLDFGVALCMQETRITRASSVGTDPYTAPEQRNRVATPTSDLYSLGVTMLHLATGSLPGSPVLRAGRAQPPELPPVRAVWPDAPEALDRLLRAMTATDPRQRPASAREVEESLLALEAPPSSPDPAAALRRAIEQVRGKELELRARQADLDRLALESEEEALSPEDAASLRELLETAPARARAARDLTLRAASLHAALAAHSARRGP